jgi:ABC-type transport system involved in multi-copper enzyme maturation permease subunit
MTMLPDLLIRDVLASVKTFRFLISLLIVVGLFVVSGLMFSARMTRSTSDFREEEAQYQHWLESMVAHLNQLATGSMQVSCPPADFQFVSAGFDDRLPNVALLNAFALRGLDNESRSNPFLPKSGVLDWTFIIGLILSFVALVLVFDAVSAEKEEGTLRTVLANPVPRSRFLLAKYLASVLALIIPLTIGILLNLLILSRSHPEILNARSAVQLLLVFGISVVYLSWFVLLGLFISSCARRSATGLVLCLVAWVVLTLVIPNLGGLLAQTFSPIRSSRDVEEGASRAASEVALGAPGEIWSCFGSDYAQPCFKMRAETWNKKLVVQTRILDAYRDEQLHQVDVGRGWTQVSPTALYTHAIADLVNAGVRRVVDFRQQVDRYREELLGYVKAKDALDPKSPHLINPDEGSLFSNRGVADGEIPKFEYREPPLPGLLPESITGAGILLILNLLLFALAMTAFNRYDVR